MAKLNETPRGDRVHIAFFGKTNAGKSSTINMLTGAETALVSPVAGTTTDPVYKSMELLPIGPVVLIDTGGTEDTTELGAARAAKTKDVAARTDIAVLIETEDKTDPELASYVEEFAKRGVPVIRVRNIHGDLPEQQEEGYVYLNAVTGEGKRELVVALRNAAAQTEDISLTEGLVKQGDLVLLVMPQNIQAPKGRLILPQVQTIRDLLDADCRVLCVKTDDLPAVFDDLARKPALVITDSQAFAEVSAAIPEDMSLTSFSILMSKKRGDVDTFVEGARQIDSLKPGDKVLVAEACTHHALKGDIARQKIPSLLDKRVGGSVQVDVVSGPNFPDNLGDYKLIIQCGGCMINRANMLSRIGAARAAEVPITNFGTALAYLAGILDRTVY